MRGAQLLWLVVAFLSMVAQANGRSELAAQNVKLLEHIEQVHGYTPQQMNELRALVRNSGYMGQGNPTITEHADTRAACSARLAAEDVPYPHADFERICGGKYMAPLYDPSRQSAEQAILALFG